MEQEHVLGPGTCQRAKVIQCTGPGASGRTENRGLPGDLRCCPFLGAPGQRRAGAEEVSKEHLSSVTEWEGQTEHERKRAPSNTPGPRLAMWLV